MNKYQEALNETIGTDYEYVRGQYKNIDLLQELVDKATPKKPNRDNWHYICCPKCGSDEIELYDYDHNEVKLKYCNKCGQALDWSEYE